MGLDIKAISNIEKTIEQDDQTIFVSEDAWVKNIKPGLYKHTPFSDIFSFNAGSYGMYNALRNTISQFALGVPAHEVWADSKAFAGKPFVELINFSDCAGFLGPDVCFKLANDFRRGSSWWLTKKDKHWDPYDDALWFSRVAEDFFFACRLAANNGILIFH